MSSVLQVIFDLISFLLRRLLFRTSGCFTSSGLILFDIIPSPSTDPTPLKSLCSAHSKGILISENRGHSPVCYSSAADSCGEFLYSESDSASDCGSDLLSEPRIQVCTLS